MLILLVLLYAFAAISFTLAKAVLAYGKPIFFVGFRMTSAGVILYAYEWFRYRRLFSINWRSDWYWFVLVAVVQIYLTYVLDLLALNNMNSFKGALIYCASPFITALFSYFFFKEPLTKLKALGLTIGFVGFLPTLLSQSGAEVGVSEFLRISSSELMMIGSVIASVWGWIIMRHLLLNGYRAVTINSFGNLGGGILALGTSLLLEGWRTSPVNNWVPFLQLTLLLILIVNLFFYNLYGYLLKRYTATFLSFAGFMSPLFAALFGWLFLGEVITWAFFVSMFMIIIGLTIFYFEELRQGYITK